MVIPREPFESAQGKRQKRGRVGLRRDYTRTPKISKSYLLGILHDATVRKNTFRVATKSHDFARVLKQAISFLNRKAWIYKEGKKRNLWIVEFSKSLLNGARVKSKQDKLDYIRGFFDAEGGIAKDPEVRFYLYFCQKNKRSLIKIKGYLSEFMIESGVIHNPSKKVDPDYWRFFIRSKSYKDFASKISSNHPEKFAILRMKI
jgi:intein-encoded DNA endonuclease-like protein